MTVQSSYLDNVPAGYAGAIANQEPRTLISRTVEDSGGIDFGLAVMQGTADKGVVVSDGNAFLGVTVRENSGEPNDPDTFEYMAEARIMTKGVIWIANSGGVAAGDEVEALADGALGAATSGNVPNARWETTASDGELAMLRLA
jgi:hypothetical protein